MIRRDLKTFFRQRFDFRKSRPRQPLRLHFEALEERMMLSAGGSRPLPHALDVRRTLASYSMTEVKKYESALAQLDQRGPKLVRNLGTARGAVRASGQPVVNFSDVMPPVASLNAPDINGSNSDSLDPYTFTITYSDDFAVDQASVKWAVVGVQPPFGSPLYAYPTSVTPLGKAGSQGNSPKEIATYRLTPPGGSWGTAPPGSYEVILSGLPVTDLAGNPIVANIVGSFSVRITVPRLVVLVQPPDLVAVGSPFNLTVALEDSLGSVATSFNGSVSIALSTNPGGAALGGKLIVQASGGVAVFSGLTLNNPAHGYRLNVSGEGLNATTAPIDATDGEIASFGFTPRPSVVLTQIVEKQDSVGQIILFFSDPMDPASLTDLNNYTLLDAGPDHEFGNRDDHIVQLKRATANAFGDSVTLTLKNPTSLGDSLCLILNRQSPSGLRDVNGAILNPWGDFTAPPKGLLFLGKPARNFTAQFLGGNSAVLAVPTVLQAPRPQSAHSSTSRSVFRA